MMKNENSARFISAYNRIDKALRNIYNLRANMTFSEVVRKAAAHSAVVRRYEDDLIDYSRLRNSIVHSSSGGIVIAEPHTSVVEELEHIERLITTPPKADGYSHRAVTLGCNKTVGESIKLMAASGFSNVPVIKENKIIGVVNNKLIVEALAKKASSDNYEDVAQFIKNSPIQNTLTEYNAHYVILDDKATIDKVLDAFSNNPKLQIVILTRKALPDSDITGVLTTGDIQRLNKVLNDY